LKTTAPATIDGLLLDMDGVLTVSWEPLPGAVAAFARLRAAGLALRVLTNTTGRSRATLAGGLRDSGFEVADEDVLSAAVAAGAHLRAAHPGKRVFLLGDAQPDDLTGIRLVGLDDDPEVVLIAGADESFVFETFNRVYRALLGGAELVAMHHTFAWLTTEGVCLDSGAYVAGLEHALGREAVVTGKPSPDFFAAGLAALGLPAGRVAMVGDDVVGDVLAAQAVGITGVLVRTGKFRPETLERAAGTPDHVVGSICDVPELLGL
jgi:HAD superfamily hydrolase (TIGR01458 family)